MDVATEGFCVGGRLVAGGGCQQEGLHALGTGATPCLGDNSWDLGAKQGIVATVLECNDFLLSWGNCLYI